MRALHGLSPIVRDAMGTTDLQKDQKDQKNPGHPDRDRDRPVDSRMQQKEGYVSTTAQRDGHEVT